VQFWERAPIANASVAGFTSRTLMSGWGHGRRFGTRHACFSTASISRPSAGTTDGALECLKQTHAPLFDYFVGKLKQCQGNFEAERFGGVEVDHKLELGRPVSPEGPPASRP
jgi:hypothetical protein